MIRQLIRTTIRDLANAVARSELAKENARLAAKVQQLEADDARQAPLWAKDVKELADAKDQVRDLRTRLEAAENERDHIRENFANAVKAAERRSPVDRSAAVAEVSAFLMQRLSRTINSVVADSYARQIVDAILGAQKEAPAEKPLKATCAECGKEYEVSRATCVACFRKVEKPAAFVPAETSEELPGLTDFRGRLNWLVKQLGHGDYGRPEVEAAKRLRDHAAAVKRVGELGEAFTDTNKRLVELADSLCRINETLGIGAVSFKDTEAAVAELLSNRNCFARRLEEKTADLARLSAPCPADAMSDGDLWARVKNTFYDSPGGCEGGFLAVIGQLRLLFGRPAK